MLVFYFAIDVTTNVSGDNWGSMLDFVIVILNFRAIVKESVRVFRSLLTFVLCGTKPMVLEL